MITFCLLKAFNICTKSVTKPRQSPDKLQGLKQQTAGRLHLSSETKLMSKQHSKPTSNNSEILLVWLISPISFNLNWKLNALLCWEWIPTPAPSLRRRNCNDLGVDYCRDGFSACRCSISFQSSTRVQGVGEILHATRQGLLLFYTLNLICRMCDPQSRRCESLCF